MLVRLPIERFVEIDPYYVTAAEDINAENGLGVFALRVDGEWMYFGGDLGIAEEFDKVRDWWMALRKDA